ncbi:hypothetical protein P2H44_07590 [Albimonas sp. CAU 1670]|uniref:hypothetical protein n=1 Tax=Albimonas sp. CAU 1670 TaxID=3032599 RepID=UPI0023D98184|nr:hypothetical protein [Albimonas sp. CAU 1670]MDF2232414.1 hypothetical protein [Albimonas sp. CAU 1670]
MRKQRDGRLYGDCEDFSLTVLSRFYGGTGAMLRRLLFSREVDVWHVETPEGGHAVAEIEVGGERLMFDNRDSNVRHAASYQLTHSRWAFRYKAGPMRVLSRMFGPWFWGAWLLAAVGLGLGLSTVV